MNNQTVFINDIESIVRLIRDRLPGREKEYRDKVFELLEKQVGNGVGLSHIGSVATTDATQFCIGEIPDPSLDALYFALVKLDAQGKAIEPLAAFSIDLAGGMIKDLTIVQVH